MQYLKKLMGCLTRNSIPANNRPSSINDEAVSWLTSVRLVIGDLIKLTMNDMLISIWRTALTLTMNAK